MSLICPTPDQFCAQALALLPRGRAWRTHETGPLPDSVLWRFWRATGELFAFVNRRLCDLHPEFFCATAAETRDLWMLEYGLPDSCDPYPDLCAKVAAFGGATCSYLAFIAGRAGWAIECALPCGAEAGCAEAGIAIAGQGAANGSLLVTVRLSQSPAYLPVDSAAEAGCLEAGAAIRCDPLESLRCLLERIVHAHLLLSYRIEA
jgi:hypothetical protein